MKKKLILLILLLLTISIGVTYAIFKWTSTNSNVTFEVEGCYITYDAGSNISGASFGPALSKDDTTNVISKKISMTPECTGVTANLTLKVDSINDGLKEQSFIYELYDGTSKIANGNFADATTGKVYNLLNTKTLTKDTTQNYTLYIYIDGSQDNPTTMGGQSFSFTLGASGDGALYKAPTNFVEKLDDGTTGDSGSGVYKVSHDAIASGNSVSGNDIPAITDYRYYGPNPNNYVCLDMAGQSSCPDRSLYRIIGSIYEEKAGINLLKVIKATTLTDGSTNVFSFDYNSSRSYKNNWSTSTLMTLLNSGAWWSNTSGSYYNNSTTAITLNFTNKGLTDTAKKMVNDSLYYLGGWNANSIKVNDMYGYERGKTTYSGNPLKWEGKVGLMYPSDYGYAAGTSCTTGTAFSSYGTCKTKNWLYNSSTFQWLMPPNPENSTFAWYVGVTGNVGHINVTTNSNGLVSPVFYLKYDVSVTGGTGTSTDPYILSLD